LSTDWLALDCEMLPWSLKAEELLRTQYAAVGAAATAGLRAAAEGLERAGRRGAPVAELLERQRDRLDMTTAFIDSYRPYCWPVAALADLRVAPFQVLAGEGGPFFDRDHRWHLGIAGRLAVKAPDLVRPTTGVEVDPANAESVEGA